MTSFPNFEFMEWIHKDIQRVSSSVASAAMYSVADDDKTLMDCFRDDQVIGDFLIVTTKPVVPNIPRWMSLCDESVQASSA